MAESVAIKATVAHDYGVRADYVLDFFASASWKLHEGQKRVIEAMRTAQFLVLMNGGRWGKSELAARLVVAVLNMPEMPIAILAPTRKQALRVFNRVWHYGVTKRLIRPAWIDSSSRSETREHIRCREGTFLDVLSGENTDQWPGQAYALVVFDEAWENDYELDFFQKIYPRLDDLRGQCLFLGTPDSQWGDKLYDRGQSDRSGRWFSMRSPTWENTFLYPGGRRDPKVLEAERDLDPLIFLQQYGAESVSFAGRAYHRYSVANDDRARCEFSPERTVAVCCDFNVDPLNWVLGHKVLCRHGTAKYDFLCFDEISLHGAVTADACEETLNRYGKGGRFGTARQFEVFGDATGQRRGTRSSESDYDIVRKVFQGHNFQLRLDHSNPRQRERVQHTNSLLASGTNLDRHHLFVHPEPCPELVADWKKVKWKNGTELIDKSDRDRTHSADAVDMWLWKEAPRRERHFDESVVEMNRDARRGGVLGQGMLELPRSESATWRGEW